MKTAIVGRIARLLESLADRTADRGTRIAWLTRALAMAPGDATLLSKRALAKGVGAGDADHAAALTLRPDDPMVHERRARAFRHAAWVAWVQGRSEVPKDFEPFLLPAIECASAALALAPGHDSARLVRLCSYMHLERRDEALADARVLVARHPGNALHRQRLGAIQAERGVYDEAIAALGEALRLDPECQGAHAWRGYCHLQAGDTASARRDADAALAMDPHDDGADAVLEAVSDGGPFPSLAVMRGAGYL